MNRNKVLLIVQSVLCVLSAVGLIVADLVIYFRGLAQQDDDPMAQIYTVDSIADHAVIICPMIALSLIITVILLILKIKDPDANRAVNVPGIRTNTSGEKSSATVLTRTVILVIAVAFIIAGILNGSIMDVFVKASKICTECIGLG